MRIMNSIVDRATNFLSAINKTKIACDTYFSKQNINNRYITDMFIMYAYGYKELGHNTNKPNLYRRLMDGQMQILREQGIMHEFEVTFDNSLWTAEDETSIHNIVRLEWSSKTPESYRLDIDLREDISKHLPK